jgi:photosystem II stability/assembly factor-like uncharacterized protein
VIAASVGAWFTISIQKVFLSRDGGLTWTDATGNLPDGPDISAMTFSNDGKYLFVGRPGGGVYRMLL